MKTKLFLLLLLYLSVSACQTPDEDLIEPVPEAWESITYQVNAVYQDGSTYYYAQADTDGQLHHSFDAIPEEHLPFRFYEHTFHSFREILISSPYPIRPNWFLASKPNCLDPGDTPAGIEFSIVAVRERDYLMIARLDSTYWKCLRADSPFAEGAGGRLSFSFQVLESKPQIPKPFNLNGFYNMKEELVHLKARKDTAGIWRRATNYQPPGSPDIAFQITKHPQLGESQSLLRISSTMLLTPHSLSIGLPYDCLDQADWEVHANRNADRFLLDIVVPDCFLDCLNNVANGFEFEVEFYQ